MILGEEVCLYLAGRLVGLATIVSMDPNALCHLVPLGEGCASVSVTKVYIPLAELPYPSCGVSHLEEVLGGFTKWNICEMKATNDLSQKQTLNYISDTDYLQPINDMGIKHGNCHVNNMEDSHLENWPSGEQNVHKIIDIDELFLSGDEEHEDPNVSIHPTTIHRKRTFGEENILISKKAKTETICSYEKVCEVAMVDCCPRRCCQLARRDVILKTRIEYWGQPFSERLTFIWDAMSLSPRNRGILMHDGVEVCQKAWYKIYGISKATFHRYKRAWLSGCVKGMHGNEGLSKESRHVTAAKETLWHFVNTTADRIPNKSRTTFEGGREPQYMLPSIYKQRDVLQEINQTLGIAHVKEISQSTFNRMWNNEFKEVQIAKNNGFSKCDFCSTIKMKLMSTKVQAERAQYMRERDEHNRLQRQCRSEYYRNRTLSCTMPEEYLCIIHDKMDKKKTSMPRLFPEPKATSQAFSLPISLTGMLTHGQGLKGYGHFAVGLWKGDSNFTIGSLAKCLRDLELFDGNSLGDLQSQQVETRENLFKSLLAHDTFNSVQSLAPNPKSKLSAQFSSTPIMTFKPLPRKLFLQMDNSGKDNKNRWLFSFLSLLVAKGIFEEITINFLMVGHTHEDIDALFGHFSEDLRRGNVFTLPQLLNIFQTCESTGTLIPYLIQEVPDFKSFVEGYIPDGSSELVGHRKPLQFRFCINNELPVMYYKMHPGNEDWLPTEGIEMWKRGQDGKPILPRGEPKLLSPTSYIKDVELVTHGLKKFVEYWKKGKQSSKPDSLFFKNIQPIIDYWEAVTEALQVPFEQHQQLRKGFWPKTSWKASLLSNTYNEEHLSEVIEKEHYCGPRNTRPSEEFQPYMDVDIGMFLLIRPYDEKECPVWLGVAASSVIKDKNNEHFLKVLVDWWEPVSK